MHTIIQQNSLSPAVKDEMAELGLLRPHMPVAAVLVLSVVMIDVAVAVLSLAIL